MFFNSSQFRPLLLAALLVFVSVCAFTAKSAMFKPTAETSVIVAEEAEVDLIAPDIAGDNSAGIDLTTDVDELLRLAQEACDNRAYITADSILRNASAFLMRSSELPDSDKWLPLQKYVAAIISMYTELFPPGFHVPDEISSMIFSHHLLQSLLTKPSEVSSQDSAYFVRLSKKRDVNYDFPVVWNDRVKNTFLFFLKRRKVLFDRWFGYTDYYLPIMKQMFINAGLPGDLAYLPILESHFDPNAYSSANAAGIWQFIPSTGRQYGLRQNYWIDERRDPIKATKAAINYLDKLYADFKNWHIALAAYNCGEKRMEQALIAADGVRDFWALTLPAESMEYVPFFISTLIIAKNHEVFEFGFPKIDSVFDPDTVFVNDCVEMKTIAEGIGIPLDTLTAINPHILRWSTPPDMKDIRIYLPKGYAGKFKEFYDSLPDTKKTKFYHYTVKSGENLAKIASIFKVHIDTLRKVNDIKAKSTTVGNYVIIPIPVNDTVPSDLASHLNVSEWEAPGQYMAWEQKHSKSLQGQSDGVILRAGKKITHKVRTGETLKSISNDFKVAVEDLLAWNHLTNPHSLKSEHTLVIYLPDSSVQAVQDTTSNAKYPGKRVVKPGETFYGISMELGIPVGELAKMNGLSARYPQIIPGYVLRYAPTASKAKAGKTTATALTKQMTKPSASTKKSGSRQVIMYKVKAGDSLWQIATNFGVTLNSIREGNNLTANSVVMPGDTLKVIK